MSYRRPSIYHPLQNIWDFFLKLSKIGLSMERLIADFFQFSIAIACKNLRWPARNLHLFHNFF